MEREITKDYMYLIVNNGNGLKAIEEKIEYNYKVEAMMNDFLRNKKDKLSMSEITEFKDKVKRYFPNFFREMSYAIQYSSSYEELGFNDSCSIGTFRDKVYDYIYANALEVFYSRYESDYKVIAYSHRKRGYKIFSWRLDSTFKFDLSTNFAYGSSSYFNMILYWKNLPIINYLHIVFYRFARYCDVQKVTESYSLIPEEWKKCFDNTVYYVNTFYNSGSSHFIKKYLDNTFVQLINGLEFNLYTNLFSVLSTNDINELFIRENYFSEIYLYSGIGPNLLLKNNNLKLNEILNIYNDDASLQAIISRTTFINKTDVDNVLEKFIKNYKSFTRLEQKAKTYIFVLELHNLLKCNSENKVISDIFNWLYVNMKAQNNYNDEKILYLIEDDYELQMKRSEQCVLTINALKNTKNNDMNYIYNLHKDKLVYLINILKNQNEVLLKKMKTEIKMLEEQIFLKENEKNMEFKILEQKQSYKNDCVYKKFFKIIKEYAPQIFTYKSNELLINDDELKNIYEQLVILMKEMNENNFDLNYILFLEDFGVGGGGYSIFYENSWYTSHAVYRDKILKNYLSDKKETDRKVLQSIVNIPKNIHEFIKNVLFDGLNNDIDDMLFYKIKKELFEDIEYIINYSIRIPLKEEYFKNAIKSFFNWYIKVFQINSSWFIENEIILNEDSKVYNTILSEWNSLNDQLNTLKNKVNNLEKYNESLVL